MILSSLCLGLLLVLCIYLSVELEKIEAVTSRNSYAIHRLGVKSQYSEQRSKRQDVDIFALKQAVRSTNSSQLGIIASKFSKNLKAFHRVKREIILSFQGILYFINQEGDDKFTLSIEAEQGLEYLYCDATSNEIIAELCKISEQKSGVDYEA